MGHVDSENFGNVDSVANTTSAGGADSGPGDISGTEDGPSGP